MNATSSQLKLLTIDVTVQELFDWANQALVNATNEERDTTFFALITGYESLIRNLFASEIINIIVPSRVRIMLKDVDVFRVRVQTCHNETIVLTNGQTKLSTA